MADRLTQLQEAVNQASKQIQCKISTYVEGSKLHFQFQLGEYFCSSIGVLQGSPEPIQQNGGHPGKVLVTSLYSLAICNTSSYDMSHS